MTERQSQSYPLDGFVDPRGSLLSGSCNLKQQDKKLRLVREDRKISRDEAQLKGGLLFEEHDRESPRNTDRQMWTLPVYVFLALIN